MTNPDPRQTVEFALSLLAGRTGEDAGQFDSWDAQIGHMLAERIVQGYALTGKQRRTAFRMLGKYSEQLAAAGVHLDRFDVPTDAPAAPVDLSAHVQRPAITVEDGRVVVRSPFSLKGVCAGINGSRWNPRAQPRGAWTYPESPRSAAAILEAFAAHDPTTDAAFDALVADAVRMAQARVHTTADDLPPIPGEAMPSWNHQRQAFWFLRELDAGMAWMEMGTGKSKVTVDLLRENDARTTLILCPAKVLGVWPKQFRLHGARGPEGAGGFHVENGFVTIGRGPSKGRREAASVEARTKMFDEALHECRCGLPHVVVANYEITTYNPFADWAQRQQWDYVVADESHRLRAVTGKWSRWAARLRANSTRRLCLTGTALGQNELDIFGQYRFLDPSIFGNSYTSFETKYAVKGGYEGHEVVAMRTKPTKRNRRGEEVDNEYFSEPLAREFDDKLFSICYEVGAEVLDLPPTRVVTRTFEMPPRARKAYRELDEDLYTDLVEIDGKGGEVSSPNVLVKMLRLQQLTGGYVNDDDGRLVEVHTAKADLLKDVLEDISPDESVVVFCRFTPDLAEVQRVAEKLKRPYAEVSGNRSDGLTEDSTLALDRGVTGVQIQAGGVGVDFTKSHTAVDYSLGFSLIDFQQSRRRLHRPGQDQPVLFVQLVAEGTIDQDVLLALEQNQEAVTFVAKRRLHGHLEQGEAS